MEWHAFIEEAQMKAQGPNYTATGASLREDRGFFLSSALKKFWAGQLVSQVGDSIFDIGLLWLMLELTGSPSQTGLVAMSAYLPALLFGMFAGALVDRFDRRRILLITDLLRTALVLLIPLFHSMGFLYPWVLGSITFLRAMCSSAFNPARDAMVPLLVSPAGLLRANSLIQSCWQLGLLFGPLIAGLLIPLVGEIHLFSLDALSYLLSFLFLLGIPRREEQPPVDHGNFLATGTQAMADVKQALVYSLRDRRILVLLLITAVDNLFIMGPAIMGAPLFIRDILGLGSGWYALAMTAYAVGMLVGTLLLNALPKRISLSHILLWGIVLDGLTFLPLLWVHSFAGFYLTIVVHSLVIPMIVIPRPTLIQQMVSPEMQGRVFSMIGVGVTGFSALSLALTGLICEFIPINRVYAGIAVLAALCGGVGWLVPEFRQAGQSTVRGTSGPEGT